MVFSISNDENAYGDPRIPRSIDRMRAQLESSAGQDHRRRAASLARGFEFNTLATDKVIPMIAVTSPELQGRTFGEESSQVNFLGRTFMGEPSEV